MMDEATVIIYTHPTEGVIKLVSDKAIDFTIVVWDEKEGFLKIDPRHFPEVLVSGPTATFLKKVYEGDFNGKV